MSGKIEGRVINIFEPEVRGNFTSRKMWVEETGEHAQTYEVVTGYKKETLFDNLTIGQLVSLDYNLRGRKWASPEGKEMVFHKIEIWRCEAKQSQPVHLHEPNTKPSVEQQGTEIDDLPF